MRTQILSLSLALIASVAVAENQETSVKVGPATLKMSIPKEAKVKTVGEETSIVANDLQIYLWAVPAAKSVADAVSHVNEVIKGEFVKYVVKTNESIKVAGHEAKHLEGTGEEADDNDAGSADVVIFTVGKNVFAACVHGEGDRAAKERPEFLKALQSLKAP